MNERIKELANQAGFPDWWIFPNEPERNNGEAASMVEKFAELIVRDCANAAYQSLYDDRAFDCSAHYIRCNVMDAIKDHFGVK